MKPIIFATPMVQAILAGKKTQTRRVIIPQPHPDLRERTKDERKPKLMAHFEESSRVKPGDILWVRETVTRIESGWWYKTDGTPDEPWGRLYDTHTWFSPRYMPRAAARIFLRVTDVRGERVREITTEDCRKEGIIASGYCGELFDFIKLWDTLNAKRGYGWDSNPWVWVYTFERIERPEV